MGVSIGGGNGICALAADRTQTAHGGAGVTAHGEVIAAFPRARAALAAAPTFAKGRSESGAGRSPTGR